MDSECYLNEGEICDPADDRCTGESTCTGSWPNFQWEMGSEDRTPICCLKYECWGPYGPAPDSACCGGKCEPDPGDDGPGCP